MDNVELLNIKKNAFYRSQISKISSLNAFMFLMRTVL